MYVLKSLETHTRLKYFQLFTGIEIYCMEMKENKHVSKTTTTKCHSRRSKINIKFTNFLNKQSIFNKYLRFFYALTDIK